MTLEKIGAACKRYREKIGLYQTHVAEDVGTTSGNVSQFECGRNNNALVFAWYVEHGFTVRDMAGEDNGATV